MGMETRLRSIHPENLGVIPSREIFPLLHSTQIRCGHLITYLVGTEGSFPKSKAVFSLKLTTDIHLMLS